MTTAPVRPQPKFTKHDHAGQAKAYDQLLDADSREVPQFIRDRHEIAGEPAQVPTRWYTDRAVHDLEVEQIWRKTWQMVCRVDEIPEVGDTHVFDIAGMSFIVLRSTPTEIRGYWNACLHRGVPLRKSSGRVDRLQCPFHGFTWGLNGACQLIPQPEEFPHIDQANFALPEVKVEQWQGFVFLNADPDAGPLSEHLGSITGEFERWPYERRYKAVHFAKVFPTNWKILQEAFMEAFHVLTTHPQFATTTSEDCSQFSAEGNWSRGVQAQGQTSVYVPWTPSEQQIFDKANRVWDDEETPNDFVLPEPSDMARAALAEQNRASLRPVFGDAVDEMSDAEVVDIFYYTLFPNFHPFAGFATPLTYRFYPYGDDHTQSVMEVLVLPPVPEGAPLPPSAPMRWVPEGEDFTYIKELGWMGTFLSQDISNMEGSLKGVRNNRRGYLNFAGSQESKIIHFYSVYEKVLGLSAADEVAELTTKS